MMENPVKSHPWAIRTGCCCFCSKPLYRVVRMLQSSYVLLLQPADSFFFICEPLTRKTKHHYPNTCTRLDLQEVLADASFSTLLEWKLVHKYEVLLGGSVWLLQSRLCPGHQGLSSPRAEEVLPKSQIPLWCPSD